MCIMRVWMTEILAVILGYVGTVLPEILKFHLTQRTCSRIFPYVEDRSQREYAVGRKEYQAHPRGLLHLDELIPRV